MMPSKNFTQEFKKELFNAIRLSVFLTTLVLGFLIFQNRTTSREEIVEMKSAPKGTSNRMPASQVTSESN